MATKKKQAGIPIDQNTYEAMNSYASLYSLSLSDLMARMWALWQRMEEMRAIQPTFPPLQEPLDAFLHEMDTQAIDLDEEYQATLKRNQAIATYQETHPFIEDSDESPAICPSCKRETTKAGLIHLTEN